jgi:hypothetical protein
MTWRSAQAQLPCARDVACTPVVFFHQDHWRIWYAPGGMDLFGSQRFLSERIGRPHLYTTLSNYFSSFPTFIIIIVWCSGQNKRIAPLSFFHGCRNRRLKDWQHLHLRWTAIGRRWTYHLSHLQCSSFSVCSIVALVKHGRLGGIYVMCPLPLRG